jgi:hypothetical protein
LEERVFCVFGPPLVIISDNGKAFANALMSASENVYGYRRIFVKPASPQSNGLAEAAVKRLKLLMDRHTVLHANWPSQIPLFQLLLNSRTHSAHGVSPFVALFGRTPYSLPALENPALVSVTDDGMQFVRDRVVLLRQLSARLKQESDNVKRAAQIAHEEKHPTRAHHICVGDYVWLTLDTDEKARLIRKYGHGAAWKHHYEVVDVRPHAVRLKIPPDAPPVMEWQSLRKCSKAPSQLHDYSSTVVLDIHGRLLTTPPGLDIPDEVPAEKSEAIRYLIERILRAERKGSGWQLTVKWVGYDEVTYEPLSSIVADTSGDPEIARQIRECQEAYLVEHPDADVIDDSITKKTGHNLPLEFPTRVQPDRAAKSTSHDLHDQTLHALIASASQEDYSFTCNLLSTSCRLLAHQVRGSMALRHWLDAV